MDRSRRGSRRCGVILRAKATFSRDDAGRLSLGWEAAAAPADATVVLAREFRADSRSGVKRSSEPGESRAFRGCKPRVEVVGFFTVAHLPCDDETRQCCHRLRNGAVARLSHQRRSSRPTAVRIQTSSAPGTARTDPCQAAAARRKRQSAHSAAAHGRPDAARGRRPRLVRTYVLTARGGVRPLRVGPSSGDEAGERVAGCRVGGRELDEAQVRVAGGSGLEVV